MRTYLLLRSILWQLAAIAEGLRPDGDDDASSSTATSTSGKSAASARSSKQSPDEGVKSETLGPRDILVAGLCTLRLLRANMYHLRAARVSPGTVGLGTSSGGHGLSWSSMSGRRGEGSGGGPGIPGSSFGTDQRNPFASGLLSLLLDYAGGVLDVIPAVSSAADEREEVAEDDPRELAALRCAVRYEAAEIIGRGLYVFLPEPAEKVAFLSELLRLAGGGGSSDMGSGGNYDDDDDDDDDGGDSKDEGRLEEGKASAIVDGLLPSDMDEEGCAALLSGVCNAVCSDPQALLSIVPESVRPPLTVRDVPSYVSSKVRSAERALAQVQAQAQALQQRMQKEAAAAANAAGSGPSSPGDGGNSGGGAGGNEGVSSRVRGSPGNDDSDGLKLWKTGPDAGLPRPGDVVIRGPDWAWGSQDGDVGGRGVVVALATWGRAARSGGAAGGVDRGAFSRIQVDGVTGGVDGANGNGSDKNAVRVMWQKGSINIYRWGAPDSADPSGKPCYDLEVLRPPTATQDEIAVGEDNVGVGSGNEGTSTKGPTSGAKNQGQAHAVGKGRTPVVRGELKWTVEEVEVALLPKKGRSKGSDGDDEDEAPSTRAVLSFLKNNAPQEWREPRRITGAENALVKVNFSLL